MFDRQRDWVDIQAMVDWGTDLDRDEALRWVGTILGHGSDQYQRLSALLEG